MIEETRYKTSMLIWLVSATAFFRDQIFFCKFFLRYKYVLLIILHLTSNKFSITEPREKVR